jgi:hypothetical protein
LGSFDLGEHRDSIFKDAVANGYMGRHFLKLHLAFQEFQQRGIDLIRARCTHAV